MNDPRDRARHLAVELGERLRPPEAVGRVAANAPRVPGQPAWDPASLLLGHPGIALLHAVLSRHDRSWATATRAHLAAAVDTSAGAARASRGGIVELVPAAVLHRTSDGGFSGLLEKASLSLAEICDSLTRTCEENLDRQGTNGPWVNYDVVTGLAGKARMLVALTDLGYERCRTALRAALRFLVALTRPVTVYGAEVPGWWSAPSQYADPDDRSRYPRGDFNLGLAHGIAGPLALLAIAERKGYRVAGSAEAMRRIVEWLLGWVREDEFGPMWPQRVSFAEQAGRSGIEPLPTRAAWCYGTAGVARAIQLAGQALGDAGLSALAVDALRGIFARPWSRADLEGPTICHGETGLLMIALRAAADHPDPALRKCVDDLADRIIGSYSPAAPFGFQHHITHRSEPFFLDSPGLLQGAAGIALALASFADRETNPSGTEWDSFLLLS
ncbi:lanthionine synthetase C family protein [Amycolatopsis anabasis]|uniref:lanthionine synthetase C family protein n=1 Tax=Amycolatopsis anabasis TaxID=1840409 RepID=UPI00131B41F6|nr:lanthionine synthetase C family protein [Amycolatopsis anabasis]